MSASPIIFPDDFVNIVQEAAKEVRDLVGLLSYTLSSLLTTNQRGGNDNALSERA